MGALALLVALLCASSSAFQSLRPRHRPPRAGRLGCVRVDGEGIAPVPYCGGKPFAGGASGVSSWCCTRSHGTSSKETLEMEG